MKKWSFNTPVDIRFEIGGTKNIKNYVREFNVKRICIVGDKNLYALGLFDKIKNYLKGYDVEIFGEIETNPSLIMAEKAVEFARKGHFDLILGVGGGSSLDISKACSVLINKEGKVEEYTSGLRSIEEPGVPLIVIPTTAGTGSDVTRWVVLWDYKKKKKSGISHPYTFPKMSIIDPELTLTLPKKAIASTGMDAMSQAIEAYWSKNSNPISDELSLRSVQIIFNNIEHSYNTKNIKYKIGMCYASLLSGLAMSSVMTNSVHSMSYALTMHYNVPHGAACAMFLPPIFELNMDHLGEKSKKFLKAIGAINAKEGAKKIHKLMKNIGLATRLRDIGVKEKDKTLLY